MKKSRNRSLRRAQQKKAEARALRQIKPVERRKPEFVTQKPIWRPRAVKTNATPAEETAVTLNWLINESLKPGIISLYLATRGNSRTAGLHHWTRGAGEKVTL